MHCIARTSDRIFALIARDHTVIRPHLFGDKPQAAATKMEIISGPFAARQRSADGDPPIRSLKSNLTRLHYWPVA
jgi:hypothetical protein